MDFTAHCLSPLGGITLASDGTALVGLWFAPQGRGVYHGGQKYFAEVLNPVHEERPDLPVFIETRRWLDEYFSGREPLPIPPLALRGSDFRRRVWQRMLEIPCGQTVTYGQLARDLGCKSAQAVGGAVGHNPISLIVPCHRVLGADGALTGYAGGIERKARLLQLEKAHSRECRLWKYEI